MVNNERGFHLTKQAASKRGPGNDAKEDGRMRWRLPEAGQNPCALRALVN